MANVLPILSLEAQLKRALRRHLKSLGFVRSATGELRPAAHSKDAIRHLHREQREAKLRSTQELIAANWPSLSEYFADGAEVVPEEIRPRLEIIAADTWQATLFRMASLTWSVPVSAGYGRRMRFLVWDDANRKLMGIFALGDPVFNLSVRDRYIGWNSIEREKRLVGVMDAYVLGAVPPYRQLLCGKLIACLVGCRDVVSAFLEKYGDRRGIISHQKKNAALAVVTTTSALGRSAVYNRLVLHGKHYFRSIGYTSGWGHFHVPNDLFEQMRTYLKRRRHHYNSNHEFGDGPNWRLRAVKQTFRLIGLDEHLLRHGINREVFISELANNARSYLKGHDTNCDYDGLLNAAQISNHARERWVVKRAARNPEYRLWSKATLLEAVRTATERDTAARGANVVSQLQHR